MTTTTIGPAPSWGLIRDGKTVLMLAEMSGYTETTHTAFEAAALQAIDVTAGWPE